MKFINWIKYAFFYVGWNVFIKGPLYVLHELHNLIEFVSLDFVNYLFFEGKKSDGFSNTPKLFGFFALLALVVFFFILISIYFTIINQNRFESGLKKLKYALKHSAISVLAIIFLPLSFIVLFYFFSQAILLSSAAFSKEYNFTFAEQLYMNIHIGTNQFDDIAYNFIKGRHESNFAAPSYDTWFNSHYNSFNFFVLVISVLVLIVLMSKIFILIFKTQIELTFLFLISPIIIAWISDYRNYKISKLKNDIIKKMVIIFSLILFLKLSTYLNTFIIDFYDYKFFSNNRPAFIVIHAFILVSTVFAISQIPKIFGQYFKTREFIKDPKTTVRNYYQNNYASYFKKDMHYHWAQKTRH